MSGNWEENLKWSTAAFRDLVWPVIKRNNAMPGNLELVEGVTEVSFAKSLDMLAGIDAWNVIDSSGIRGIASRVQVCPMRYPPYNTFTIRYRRANGAKTEYQKRKEQIASDKGLIYPHISIHAYVSAKRNGKLRSIGIALTKDIIGKISHWLDMGKPTDYGVYIKPVYTDGLLDAEFCVVDWTSDIIQWRYEA